MRKVYNNYSEIITMTSAGMGTLAFVKRMGKNLAGKAVRGEEGG